MKQLGLKLRTWGGKRRGAGRKPNGDQAGVSHLRRPDLAARHPVHVTVHLANGVGYLRGHSRVRAVERALSEAKIRFGMRIIHYSIQGNHLHLIVEAYDRRALARGMQGLLIRLALALNGLAHRRGKVFADRYHSHVLRSRRETARAVRYVLGNYRHHTFETLPPRWDDPCSSARYLGAAPEEDAPVVAPRTWLLRVGWRGAAP
jgi:REP element-mobilizing transposase RayT